MIGENATAINIQFVHVFIKLTSLTADIWIVKGNK